jgi:tRNA-2-methylthio-N6-dimethylallyladenosine synthase
MKYYIQSFGCQMNVYDAKSMMGLLNEAGHESTSHLEEAELILLNTCAIREGAEQRVRGRIGQLKKYKDRGSLKYLGVCGCMGQKEGERLTRDVPFLDLVMGPGAIGSIVRLVDALERGNRPVLDLHGIDDDFDEVYPVADEEIVYPRFLSIMKGCDKKCTYCIVPYTRGPERSRDPQILLQEAESLVQKGYKEITLIGQTVNSYHFGDVHFPKLLEMVNQIAGLKRIRFATSHPNSVTHEMLDAIATLDHVCEHLHLPVQSGSNRVLAEMDRNYTREDYLEITRYFRSRFKAPLIQSTLTTDIIVGFPGETEEDFEQTLDLIRSVRFDGAFMFKYSPRRGTPAAEMENQVDDFTKARRLERLIQLQQQIAGENNRWLIGQKAEVMVERVSHHPKQGRVYEARLRTGRIVKLINPEIEYRVGDMFDVIITDCSSYSLYGNPDHDGSNPKQLEIA